MNTDNPKGNIMTTTQDPYAPESATDALMVKDTRTPAERRLAALLDARGANEQATEPEAVLRAIALELIEREQADRHELQAQGKHPSPCARFCEATAFGIKIRDLEAQLRAALAAPQPLTNRDDENYCRCEPSDYVRPADYDGDGSVDGLARRAAKEAITKGPAA